MVGERDEAVPGDEAQAAPAVRDALAALEAGHDRRARSLLQAHLSHTNDPEAMKLLGDVLHGLGDQPGAGAVWFVLGGKGPVVGSAVEAWRAKHGDDFTKMWNSLPAGVRTEPLSPRLAALKAKADEAEQARRAAEVETQRAADAAPEAKTGAEADAGRARGAADGVGAGAETGAGAGAAQGRSTATASARDRDRERERDRVKDRDRDGDDEKSGFDAAKIIAWVLAALFVVCAVVGLITILQWLVPGT